MSWGREVCGSDEQELRLWKRLENPVHLRMDGSDVGTGTFSEAEEIVRKGPPSNVVANITHVFVEFLGTFRGPTLIRGKRYPRFHRLDRPDQCFDGAVRRVLIEEWRDDLKA